MQLNTFFKIALLATVATSMTTEVFAAEAAATTALNVRTGPGTEFAVIDTLFTGERVDATECQTNGWCFISHDGGPDGWVSGRYLGVVGGFDGSGSNNNNGAGANNNSGNSNSSNDDAAAAAAAAAILGIGALIIGGAIASSNQQPDQHPDTCKQGYVWREARPSDHVCVTPQRRAKAKQENAPAAMRINPLGAFGPKTCKVGFVWREAYPSDKVCVTPMRRAQVKKENIDGPSHRVNS